MTINTWVKRWAYWMAGLALAAMLSACTLQAGLERSPASQTLIPTVTSTPARHTQKPADDEETAGPTERTSSTHSADSADTSTPEPEQATHISQPANTLPPPTSTPVPPPVILALDAHPTEGDAVGDAIFVTWETRHADTVRACVRPYIPGLSVETCATELGESGGVAIDIADGPTGTWLVDLVVNFAQPDADSQTIEVRYGCQHQWAFLPVDHRTCPSGAATATDAAAQPFENGWMLYLVDAGRYLILLDPPYEGDTARGAYYSVFDPIGEGTDTSGEVQAPDGFVAPTSGFGLVWRGDVANSPGYRDELGWALEPEFGYLATYQCDKAQHAWQICYVTHPDETSMALMPQGYWFYRNNPNS